MEEEKSQFFFFFKNRFFLDELQNLVALTKKLLFLNFVPMELFSQFSKYSG